MTVIVKGDWTEVWVPYSDPDSWGYSTPDTCMDHVDIEVIEEVVLGYLAEEGALSLTESLTKALHGMLDDGPKTSPSSGAWSLDDLRRKGIDLGRPFEVHIDKTGGVVKARQRKWDGSEEW